MNELTKTLIAIVVAAGLVGLVQATRPANLTSDKFSDQGELFFPEFNDPLEATVLEVLGYDDETASVIPFKVEFQDGRWTIPSHQGYPADAEQNMAQAASSFIDLRKQAVVSDTPADHQTLGVLGPDDQQAPLSGRGTRVSFSAGDGRNLASLIIGHEATDMNQGGGPKKYYVRLPGKSRVYAASFTSVFTTDFADWVETDLLQLAGVSIDLIIIDPYEVDEAAGQKILGEQLTLQRPSTSQDWQLLSSVSGPLAEGETVDAGQVNQIISALRQLKIVGVRRKSDRLATFFAGQSKGITEGDSQDLLARGFFITNQGTFAANTGELKFSIGDGVHYTLYFGEVLRSSGRALSAGLPQAESDAIAPAEDQSTTQETRYAFVQVGFDPSLVPEPEAPPVGEGESSGPDEDAQAEYKRALADRTAQLEAGRARALRLGQRFAQWYYVIDAASFDRLRPSRDSLVQSAGAAQTGAATQNLGPVLPQGGPG